MVSEGTHLLNLPILIKYYRVILPDRNRKDVDEISKEIRDNITFYFVKNISDVINIALDTGLSLEEVENIVKLTYSNVNKNSKL